MKSALQALQQEAYSAGKDRLRLCPITSDYLTTSGVKCGERLREEGDDRKLRLEGVMLIAVRETRSTEDRQDRFLGDRAVYGRLLRPAR